MINKFNLKSMVVGGLIGGMLTTGIGYAASQLTSIEVSMNPVTFMHNGQQLELEDGKPSFIYDGSAYVPLRWLSESMGKTVEWNEENRTINIIDQVVEEEKDVNEEVKQGEENKQEQGTETVAAQLTLDKEEYTATEVLHFTITNDGSGPISFGRPFSLEYLKDGEWVEQPLDLTFTMELIILSANETFTQEVDLGQLGLQEGTYKLIKHVFDEENKTAAEISATFEMKE